MKERSTNIVRTTGLMPFQLLDLEWEDQPPMFEGVGRPFRSRSFPGLVYTDLEDFAGLFSRFAQTDMRVRQFWASSVNFFVRIHLKFG